MINNQLEAFSQIPDCDKQVMSDLGAILKVLNLKIASLKKRLLKITKQNYQDSFNALTTIPAIGPKTAVMLIAITNNFQKFDDTKKLSSYGGLGKI